MWHLVGQPRKGISSGYWKCASKRFELIRVKNAFMTARKKGELTWTG